MIEKSILYSRIWLPDSDSAERQAELKEMIPRRSARRMSQLGKVVYWLLDPNTPTEQDALVYGTTYAENRALGKYIEGLPHAASPTLFQTSIHPSAIQQALIARQQPLRSLIPMAGEASGLFEKMCFAALHRSEAQAWLVLGEEAGECLVEYGLASDSTWGIAVCLGPKGAQESLGSVRWSSEKIPGDQRDGLCWAKWLNEGRGQCSTPFPGGGVLHWQWEHEN